jgi:hypothetical protein
MNDKISRATAAMAESIDLILASDDDGETKAKSLAESFQQMEEYLIKNTGDGDDSVNQSHHVSQLADLIVEGSGGKVSREMALTHRLHSRDGAALLHRTRTSKKDYSPMTKEQLEAKRSDVLKALGKDVMTVAKSIVAQESNPGLDEHDFTAAVTSYAQSIYPNDRADTAFAKVFAESETIR